VNKANNARVCKLYLQYDESNIEHTEAKKLTDSYINAQSYDQALGVFLKLANNGDRFFQHNAGVLLQCIESIRDYDSAYRWFSASAKQGYAPAKERLGCMYEFGDGSVPVDMPTAMTLYSESAAQGNIHGMYNLGMLISEGNSCIPRNLDAAEELLLQAAEKGHALMKLNLGLFYLGIAEQEDKASRWFNLAVEQDPVVAIDLGLWYLESSAVHPHYLKLSHFWLGVAVSFGHRDEVLEALGDNSTETIQKLSRTETLH